MTTFYNLKKVILSPFKELQQRADNLQRRSRGRRSVLPGG